MSIRQARPLAVVTGGRRGIGAGIAVELAARGFNLAVTDVESEGIEEIIAAAHSCGSEAKI